MVSQVELCVFGPVTAQGPSGPIALPRAKERTLLAALALFHGRVVSTDRLADAVWADWPPAGAEKVLRTHVHRLRSSLGSGVIETHSDGYAIAPDVVIDAELFEAEASADDSAPGLRAALGRWRGEPYVDLGGWAPAELERTRLAEVRDGALETCLALEIEAGGAAGCIAELEAIVADTPLRERRWFLLMTALSRAGRVADALRAYQRACKVFAQELGIDPGPELRDLEEQILLADVCDAHRGNLPRQLTSFVGREREVAQLASLVRLFQNVDVIEVPETRYTKTSDGVHIAYQVVGDGPFDLVFMSTWFSHIDVQWEHPSFARFLRRLASFSRLILFDKRGTGESDPVSLPSLPTLESWIEDIVAVLDAARSPRTALMGDSSGGILATLFAATHPDRTTALVLSDAIARGSSAPSYPSGALDKLTPQDIEATWGTESGLELETTAPSVANDRGFRSWWARYQRLSVSPAMAAAVWDMFRSVDVREVLPAIRVPTLVLHRRDNRWLPVEHGRFIADHVTGAKFVALEGADQWPYLGDSDALLDEVEEFLTGVRSGPSSDRVLATVLLTDIVASTVHMADIGDKKWRDLLDLHDQTTRRQLERFRGREVNTTGDGFAATFDGPGRAIRCACAIRDAVRSLGIDLRTGLHTGEIELRGSDVSGMAVHIGARVSALADPGEVLVSGAIPPLVVGSGIEFKDRGEHVLKGVPGTWRLFTVVG
jgi:DNA-binding SARP family transcriptional activator/pimeloyl-ACP methyl ester carboxylesterase